MARSSQATTELFKGKQIFESQIEVRDRSFFIREGRLVEIWKALHFFWWPTPPCLYFSRWPIPDPVLFYMTPPLSACIFLGGPHFEGVFLGGGPPHFHQPPSLIKNERSLSMFTVPYILSIFNGTRWNSWVLRSRSCSWSSKRTK